MRRKSKKIAKERIKKIIDFVLEYSHVLKDEEKEKALELCLKIWKRNNLRNFPIFKRYFYCHHCKSILIPGRTSTIRIRTGKVKYITIKCLRCFKNYRIPLVKKERTEDKLKRNKEMMKK